ncbi:T9SS type B sorting domain-containing protein [Algibacter sp. R77976]|uniref:T9SS type B sorting domain-containing protein n=1 Tax=Algibacter sp. R77976 TaxID=3093873 RepID=UPI0037CA022B
MKTILLAFLVFTTLTYGQCPEGDVTFNSQVDVNNFIESYPNCDNISGNLLITGSVTNLSSLDYITSIEGDFIIRDTQLTTISNFNTLKEVLTIIDISENAVLTEIQGFNSLIDLGFLFKIENNPNLVTVNGFNNATDVFGDLWINGNSALQTINGYNKLVTVREFFGINDSPLLTSIPSFNNLNYVGWGIQFYNTGLTDIPDFDNLTSIGGIDPTSGFNVSNNQNLVSISGFNCLENIVFDFLIQENPKLENIMGLSSLVNVGQFFTIRNNVSLTTLNGLQNLSSVSTTGYENTVVLNIHDNPQLTDCDPLCNLLSSNAITGLINISDNFTGCNSEAEINTSSCIPLVFLGCTELVNPTNGDINVDIDTDISWNPIPGATSYLLSIGTTSEGSQIIDNLNVDNATSYDLPTNLPGNTEIFVKVKPYNTLEYAKCCKEESFTTINATPNCTQLATPTTNATDVAVSTDITWNEVIGATGYFINIGTSSGATDIANNLDVGDFKSYNPTTDFPENTTIFITITPYNDLGKASGCIEESFKTEVFIPDCTSLTHPLNGAINVDVETNLSWHASPKATGYYLNVGITPFGSEIINTQDIGNLTNYSLSENLPFNTLVYVTITPYKGTEYLESCLVESFTTENESIYIPKFFTPNNDGYNDSWIIKDPLNEVGVVHIYNRKGKLLKTLYNSQNGWNGLFNNQSVPSNDYWYVIKFKNGNKKNGHFTLKR